MMRMCAKSITKQVILCNVNVNVNKQNIIYIKNTLSSCCIRNAKQSVVYARRVPLARVQINKVYTITIKRVLIHM